MGDPADDDAVATRQTEDPKSSTKVEVPERISRPRLEGAPEFGPRYRVIGVLGKGGMGQVYRAYDTELRNEVAIKIVREDMESAGYQRFLREIALSRKVTSPNVLRVFDLAEHEGLRFLTMELVEGEDLAALLRREPRLPRERALAIFRQVCAGLVAAHKQGVVHRDLKPHNVLVDREDAVRVADFGLARSIGDSGVTVSGAVLGSPAYMSPEQVKGDAVDERSDIYSLGVMLYQLLCGQTPFQGDSAHAVMEMRLHKKPQPLRELVPDLPAKYEAVAAKCLAVDPNGRYASVAALLADLDGDASVSMPAAPAAVPSRTRKRTIAIVASALVVAAVVGMVAFVWTRGESTRSTPPTPTEPAQIAHLPTTTMLVLPAKNETTEPGLDGTVDIVLYLALRRSERIDPIAGYELHMLASELGAGEPTDAALAHLLPEYDETEVFVARPAARFRGKTLVLSVTVTDAKRGGVVAETSVDTSVDRAAGAIGRLAAALRANGGERVEPGTEELNGLTDNIQAAHEYALGLQMTKTGDDRGALEHLIRAVELDPKCAHAHATLSVAYVNASRLADAARSSQLSLDNVDRLSERDRLLLRAGHFMYATGEHDRALLAYRDVLDKWPRDRSALANIVVAYALKHDYKAALAAQKHAMKYMGREMLAHSNLTNLLLLESEFEAAIGEATTTIAGFPRVFPVVYQYKALAHYALGDYAAATDTYAKLREQDASLGAIGEADFALAQGRPADAVKLLEPSIESDVKDGLVDAAEVKLAMLAEAQLRLGNRAAAITAASRIETSAWATLRAALVLADTGDTARATKAGERLDRQPGQDAKTFAALIAAATLRARGKADDAAASIRRALRTTTLWIANLLLGRALVEAGKFDEAVSELRSVIARRGEGIVTSDDVPNARDLPVAYYYLARALDGANSPDAAQAYQAFLDMHPRAERDPLVDNARRRLSALKR